MGNGFPFLLVFIWSLWPVLFHLNLCISYLAEIAPWWLISRSNVAKWKTLQVLPSLCNLYTNWLEKIPLILGSQYVEQMTPFTRRYISHVINLTLKYDSNDDEIFFPIFLSGFHWSVVYLERIMSIHLIHVGVGIAKLYSMFVPSQWEMMLFCNAVSHWWSENLESGLLMCTVSTCLVMHGRCHKAQLSWGMVVWSSFIG